MSIKLERTSQPLCGRRRRTQGGNNIVEFALVLPILVFLSFGAITSGLLLERYLNVINLVRNAGNMYSRNVKFEFVANRGLLVRAATDLNMTTTGGQGVIFLSRVVVAQFGPNQDLPVIDRRFVIGNPSIASSRIGTPAAVDPVTGVVTDPEIDFTAKVVPGAATTFQNMINAGADRVFIAEVAHTPADLVLLGLFDGSMYSRAFF